MQSRKGEDLIMATNLFEDEETNDAIAFDEDEFERELMKLKGKIDGNDNEDANVYAEWLKDERKSGPGRTPNGLGLRKESKMGSTITMNMPEKLGPQHMTVLALVATGLKNKEIATIVGCTKEHVSSIRRHPDALPLLMQLTADHVAGVVEDVGEMIKASAGEAFLKVQDLMRNAKREEVQRDCAFDLLDRAGFGKSVVAAPPAVNFGEDGARRIIEAMHDTRRELKDLKEVGGEVIKERLAKEEERSLGGVVVYGE